MTDSAGNSGQNPAQSVPTAVGTTADLLVRARAGDGSAETVLFRRYHPILRRLAHGRLPGRARDLKDTDDLVQETLVQAFKRLEHFEYRREGAFLSYLRQILLNQVRMEIRRRKPQPDHAPLGEEHMDGARTPAEDYSWVENLERYDRALKELNEEQREAVILRLELGYSYEEIANILERSSANAARMQVARGLARLAKLMGSVRPDEEVSS
jgi:RNA polymerase sigma factor (sigma-70 family)